MEFSLPRYVVIKRVLSLDSISLPLHLYVGDIVDDAIYNFSRVYQQYALQGDASEDEREMAEKRGSLSPSDEDRYVAATSPSSSKKRGSPKEKKNGFEKVNLLESDEEEIF